MTKIQLIDVSFSGMFFYNPHVQGKLAKFTHTFDFGKAYLIDGSDHFDSWILSLLIAGHLEPDSGNILLDEVPVTHSTIRDQSWLVRFDEIKKWGLFKQSVKSQLLAALRSSITEQSISEKEIIKTFRLSAGRYNRKMSQLSHEKWRASCAIGYAYGKRIFCFPDIDFFRPQLLEEYRELWLEEMFRFLTDHNVLIIIPASFSSVLDGWFDEVIWLKP